MNKLEAEHLCSLCCDQYGAKAARLVPLEDGRSWAVYIKQPGYFLWSFSCWTAYRHEEKQQAKKARKRREDVYQGAIDYEVVHQVLLPV